MNIFKYIKTITLTFLVAILLTTSNIYIDEVQAEPQPVQNNVVAEEINPITIINSPKTYINHTILINGKFDKFTTLGLDYKPAYKSSDEYISFLIKRNDTAYDIPLSEMKFFLKRDEAEKFIDLKANDEIKIRGIVFSDALGDVWIDVSKIEITKKAE